MESSNQTVDVVQLANVLGNKHTRSFVIKTDKSEVNVRLPMPLQLDDRLFYTLKLRSFNGWQSVININEANNKFRYLAPIANWVQINIPRGLYSVSQINDILHTTMKENGHYDATYNKYYVNIIVDENQNRCYLNLTNGYQLDLTSSDIHLIFGFEKKNYIEQNTNIYAPNIGKISNSLEMLIYCDLVEPNVFIDTKGYVQYIQYLATYPLYLSPPNSRLTIIDSDPDKFKIIKSKYNNYDFTIKLLNENLQPLDFNGETSVITLVLESC